MGIRLLEGLVRSTTSSVVSFKDYEIGLLVQISLRDSRRKGDL